MINDFTISQSWIGNKFKQVTKFIFIILILPMLLSSCSIYSAGFNCPDSKGARCMMLSEVDKQVDSGEIETVYLNRKCCGNSCRLEHSNVPKKALNQIHKVKIMPIENVSETYQDGDNLYLK
jgi:hypothetical protein